MKSYIRPNTNDDHEDGDLADDEDDADHDHDDDRNRARRASFLVLMHMS